MISCRSLSSLLIAIILFSSVLPCYAVRYEPTQNFDFAPTPGLGKLTGRIEAGYDTWQLLPTENDNGGWQLYRYSNTQYAALAVGPPVAVASGIDSEEELINSIHSLLRGHAKTFGFHDSELFTKQFRRVRDRKILLLEQRIHDNPVYGSFVVVGMCHDNRITTIKSRLFGADHYGDYVLSETEAIRLAQNAGDFATRDNSISKVWFPVKFGSENIVRAAYQIILSTEIEHIKPAVFIDAENGEILAAENRVMFEEVEGNVNGLYKAWYADDNLSEGAFPFELIRLPGNRNIYSDADGDFAIRADEDDLPFTFTTELRGRWVNVDYEDGDDALWQFELDSLDAFDMTWGANRSRHDERGLYYHVNFIHEFWKDVDEDFDGMDFPIRAICMYGDGYDNAFFNGQAMAFGGGNRYDNFALYADVIYHEFGHGVTAGVYAPNWLPYEDESGALNEAWSDYFPCSISDESYIGEGGLHPNGFMRNLDNDLVYPDDWAGQVHADSRMVSAAMWHSRDELGAEVTDPLFHFARYELAQDFITYFTDVLITDDDDGDISNGTPNSEVLYEQFGRHGIGPGAHPDLKALDLDIRDDSTGGAAGNSNYIWESGETVRVSVGVFRDGSLYPPPVEGVTVTMRTDFDGVEILNDEVELGAIYVGDTLYTESPLLFSILEDAEKGFANLYITISIDSTVFNIDTLNFPVGEVDLLLVRDGSGGSDQSYWFEESLDELGLIYAKHTTVSSFVGIADRFTGINTVIWFTGDSFDDVLTNSSLDALEDYLDRGGRLLLTGQGVGHAIQATEFLAEYMRAEVIDIETGMRLEILGVEDDPISRGKNIIAFGGNGAFNQTDPEALFPLDGGKTIYKWRRIEGEPAAGISFWNDETDARTVLISFGLEAVNGGGNTAPREEVIGNVLEWFEADLSVEDESTMAPIQFVISDPYPNPFNNSINVPFTLSKTGEVSLQVFDISGRLVYSDAKDFKSGTSSWSIAAENWGAGLYFIHFGSAEGSRIMRSVLIK